MKLKKFFVISAVVALVYAVVNPFLSNNLATLPLWSVLVAVGAILPAAIALVAQQESLKIFAVDYLSIRNTDWRNAAIIIGATAVLLPILKTILVGVLGNQFGLSAFGYLLPSFHTQLFGLWDYTSSSFADLFVVVSAKIVYLLVIGSIIGIVSCIFEEIAWRGFLMKYLGGSEVSKIIVSAVVWTLWSLAMTYCHATVTGVVISLIINTMISWYLVRIARATGSVWTCAMVRGIFALGAATFWIMPGSTVGQGIITILSVLAIMSVAILLGARSVGDAED